MAVAKYIELANELRKEVLSGRYGSEGGLPSVNEIAKQHSVVVNTVKVALSRLEGEGLIIKRGQGWYVNRIEVMMTRHVPLPPTRLQPRRGYVRTLHVSTGHLPEYVARKLNLSAESSVVIRNQISGEVNGHELPLQLTTRYYFLAFSDAQLNRLKQEADWDPMWDIVALLHSRDEICSRPATTQESKQLNLPEGTSVIAVWEVVRDPNGALLMAQEVTLSPRDTLVFEFSFENKP